MRLRPRCIFCSSAAAAPIYTLSLHDALPILISGDFGIGYRTWQSYTIVDYPGVLVGMATIGVLGWLTRSEEHTSELQSHSDLVCRLLLEKKKVQALKALDVAARLGKPLAAQG